MDVLINEWLLESTSVTRALFVKKLENIWSTIEDLLPERNVGIFPESNLENPLEIVQSLSLRPPTEETWSPHS